MVFAATVFRDLPVIFVASFEDRISFDIAYLLEMKYQEVFIRKRPFFATRQRRVNHGVNRPHEAA